MKYRKKPVEIEAHRNTSAIWDDENSDHPEWLQDAIDAGTVFLSQRQTFIKTLEGVMHARYGDWIIRGVKGELYPCKPEIFEQTYEAVS